MANIPEENTPKAWHRYFGIECNNLGWDLTVSKRTPEQDHQLLDIAHASSLHWKAVGTEQNSMRATMLLAEAHCLVGSSSLALEYATRMHSYFAAQPTDPWELALAEGILAHAAKLCGREQLHKDMYTQANATLGKIESEEDREIVKATFAHVPAF